MSSGSGKKHGGAKFTYHPFEVTLCGYSGAGKTTLAAKLLRLWAPRFRVGYVKHDAHRFEMDKPGKDTYEATQAGAAAVQINDPRHHAHISALPYSRFARSYGFIDTDFVLAEGFKQSGLPKILLLDADGRALRELGAGAFQNVIAVAGGESKPPRGLAYPYFHRDDVETIATFIEARFREQARAPLYGLVLAGGQSTRMGRPKWALDYQGEPHAVRMARLLTPQCEQVFLSVRPGQEAEELPELPRITDCYPAWGPTTGILSAMQAYPEAAWLVVACDLPFLDSGTLAHLVAEASPFKIATAYRSANDGLPEPLCAIYQPRAAQRLLQAAGLGMTCPRKVLIESAPKLLDLQNPRALENANTPDEYASAVALLKETVHG
jgi:molybdopterin-guanine dinucleotide biosynthesis protein MobB